ncbi:MAG: alpha-galactosidase, partial [Phycisphaerales bacterium]|nr:alpha-galactosidase [Phycisphaerales bacterium]
MSDVRIAIITFCIALAVGFGRARAEDVDAAHARIATAHLKLDYDLTKGRFDLTTSRGEPVLRRARDLVEERGSATSSAEDRCVRKIVHRGERELRVLSHDPSSGLDFETRIDLLPDRAAALVELVITNKSPKPTKIALAEPVHVAINEGGGCFFDASRVLTNGYIYYDSGRLEAFDAAAKTKIDSFWNAAFCSGQVGSGQGRRGLIVGFVDGDRAEGRVRASRDHNDLSKPAGTEFNLAARALFHPNFVLPHGGSVRTGRVLLELSDDPHAALEHYADLCAERRQAKLNPVINGWCSWFVYYGGVSEAEVLKNAQFIAKELKPYGMEWIQIDDGFYRAFGDWEGNERFPNGMKHTADEIRKLGLKPGLWIAPYCISEQSEIATKHPEWLVQDPNGGPQKIEQAHLAQAKYILDVTHPAAQQWLSQQFKTIAQDWGYRFIKTDFVEWTLLAAGQFHDPTVTKSQAYRLGDQLMRDAMGPDAHFLDCGPGNEVVGLIDSMRIGLDRPDDLPKFQLWEQYAGHANSTIPSVAKRYYFHNRTWINDPDHLRTKRLTIPQAQAAATIVALSGGTTISGDKLYELDR